MPLGSPIGSGMGLSDPYDLSIILEQATVPVVLDAGVVTLMTAFAMELSCDAVLCASDLARPRSGGDRPVRSGLAWAGRLAFGAGRIPAPLRAASSPTHALPALGGPRA